jgi:hypothetical protein
MNPVRLFLDNVQRRIQEWRDRRAERRRGLLLDTDALRRWER